MRMVLAKVRVMGMLMLMQLMEMAMAKVFVMKLVMRIM